MKSARPKALTVEGRRRQAGMAERHSFFPLTRLRSSCYWAVPITECVVDTQAPLCNVQQKNFHS